MCIRDSSRQKYYSFVWQSYFWLLADFFSRPGLRFESGHELIVWAGSDKNLAWMRFLARATLFISGLTLLVMILGPLVRAEDAGLACPDWPLCHGHAVPPYEFRVYLEVIHRYAAALLALATLTWAVVIFVKKEFRHLWIPAALALGLLTTQILLGALTITKQLERCV